MGYGKFEYTREGVNHFSGICPPSQTGRALSELNSPSNPQDPFMTRDPSSFMHSLLLHQDEGVPARWKSVLFHFLCLVPPMIRFVRRTALQHSVADPRDVTSSSMSCVVFGYTLSQKIIVIFPDRIGPVVRGNGSSLVDLIQHLQQE